MDTSTGRFISSDTYQGNIFEPVTLHKYLYANANPISYCDPSGYSSILELEAGQAASVHIDQAQAMHNSWALATGMKLLRDLSFSIGATCMVRELIEDIINNITELTNGNITSADINADVRDETIDGEIEKQDSETSTEVDGNDLEGPAGKTLPRTNKDGEVIGDRTYDSDGRADIDTDYTDHGNPKHHPKVPHKHKWDWSKPSKPIRLPWDL